MKTAVLVKGPLIGIVSMAELGHCSVLVSQDSRPRSPYIEFMDDPGAAGAAFRDALETSKRRGWRMIYAGPVLRG